MCYSLSPHHPISLSIIKIMITHPKIILKKGKEKPILRGHPWVFSGAVARAEGDLSPGEIGEVYSGDGKFFK